KRPSASRRTTSASSSVGGPTPSSPSAPTRKAAGITITGQGLSLTLDTIRRHIEGEITIALYAINPATQRCKWVAIDADYKDALNDLIKLGYYLKQDGVESALEKSNRGGQLWVLMAEPLPA